MDSPSSINQVTIVSSSYGNAPDVDESKMEASNRVVTSVSQLVQLGETDILDARKLVLAARRITAKIQGAPPYDPAKLKAQGKSWKRNVSTRTLQKVIQRGADRFAMPILTASTLTAAELPAGWPGGQEKTRFFRDTITKTIRSWMKQDMFWRGLSTEVCGYSYAFASWTDPQEWRPHFCRMDRGFVPRGSEVMDSKLGRFLLKWDYRPDELLNLVRGAVDAGSEHWKKEAVAAAVQAATLPSMPQDMSNLRKWEELIRENSWDYNYSRSQRMVECRHQFILEYSGKVSHYITWPNGPEQFQLLYENLDAYESPDNVVIPVVFEFGDGTIQGSWGIGARCYDVAAQLEKIRNDSIDNLLNSNKARLQVPNAKDAASAQLVVNDTTIIATGAQFAQNVGGISGDPKGYMILDDKMNQWMEELVGQYLPPVPLGPSDIKAAQINAANNREQEAQRAVLELWMRQIARIVHEMTRRLLNPDSEDPVAKATRAKLLGKLGEDMPPQPVSLTEKEIELLVNQPAIQSVTDFTEWAASQRAQFCASVQNNPLFNQEALARYMAAGVPNAGSAFVDEVVVPRGDTTQITIQTRQQMLENSAMLILSQAVPVAVTDNHVVHWDALVKPLEQAIMGGAIPQAQAGLTHLSAHYGAGVGSRTWPPDRINADKATLARLQRALEAKQQEVQQAQMAQQGGIPPGAPAPIPAQA